MIGLDTNVVVRYIAQDDPRQSSIATKFIESLTQDQPGFISIITLIELVWVMQGAYKTDKDQILQVLQGLLQTKEIVVQDTDVVAQAIAQCMNTRAGFADCLISRLGRKNGCDETVTFDKLASEIDGMRLLR